MRKLDAEYKCLWCGSSKGSGLKGVVRQYTVSGDVSMHYHERCRDALSYYTLYNVLVPELVNSLTEQQFKDQCLKSAIKDYRNGNNNNRDRKAKASRI